MRNGVALSEHPAQGCQRMSPGPVRATIHDRLVRLGLVLLLGIVTLLWLGFLVWAISLLCRVV